MAPVPFFWRGSVPASCSRLSLRRASPTRSADMSRARGFLPGMAMARASSWRAAIDGFGSQAILTRPRTQGPSTGGS